MKRKKTILKINFMKKLTEKELLKKRQELKMKLKELDKELDLDLLKDKKK